LGILLGETLKFERVHFRTFNATSAWRLDRFLTIWFVARRSIQLSYGRIGFLRAWKQLTARSAFCSTATFEAFEASR
jgi:hypothetical protein